MLDGAFAAPRLDWPSNDAFAPDLCPAVLILLLCQGLEREWGKIVDMVTEHFRYLFSGRFPR